VRENGHVHVRARARARASLLSSLFSPLSSFSRVAFLLSRYLSTSLRPPSPRLSLIPPSLPSPLFFLISRQREHSLANLPYTFVCLNWVAFYTRAWSVNRILNYYSDCVSLEGAPISVGCRSTFSLLSPLSPLSLVSRCPRIFTGRRPRRRSPRRARTHHAAIVDLFLAKSITLRFRIRWSIEKSIALNDTLYSWTRVPIAARN